MLKIGPFAPLHTDAFGMRCVAIRHDAPMHIRGRIVAARNATHDKRIHVGRAFDRFCAFYHFTVFYTYFLWALLDAWGHFLFGSSRPGPQLPPISFLKA